MGIFGEQLQDPANVGAIIRTAAALNASALWLTPDSADVYHPKVVRATSGVLLALPIFVARDVSGLIRQGCQIFTAEVTGDRTVSIDEIHQVPGKLVLAVGNESRGLSAQIRGLATTRFTIPLSRDVESLNVAATVAIATFYFSRLPQREMTQSPFARAKGFWPIGHQSKMGSEEWCRGTELNCRHQPFQGCALPTELPRHAGFPNSCITCHHHRAAPF